MKFVSLAEVGKIVTGKTPKTSNPEFFDGATPFVTPSDMAGERTIYRTGRSLSEAGVKSVKNCVVPKGAVMVSCIGSDMGKAHIAATKSVTNQQINTIIVDEKVFSPLFVYYNLSGRRAELREKAGGAAQPILNKTDFGKVEIECPPLAEQREISAILGVLDDKIEVNRKASSTLEEMARALYRSWFVDFDPVWARLEGRQPAHMDAATAALFPDSFGDDGLPVGWLGGILSDLIEFNPKERLQKGTPAPYFDMKSLPTSGMTADAPILRDFTSGTKFRAMDTLLARITPCLENGKSAMIDDLGEHEVAWGSTEFIVMRARSGIPASLPYCVARDQAFREEAIATMTGSSGRQRADAERISSLRAAIPDAAVLKAFGGITMPMISRIHECGRESRILATLRDTLLPRLMSGELRVDEARELVEEVA